LAESSERAKPLGVPHSRGSDTLAAMSTAGIIIIRNEILSGKIADENIAFLCRELYALGVEVRRVSIIPDLLEEIAEEVREISAAFDYVLTSGGVGPTHDDLTVEGVALAFDRALVLRDEILDVLRRFHASPISDSQRKMAMLPEGAILVGDADVLFPVTMVENVFLFPGIPSLLRRNFEDVRPRFSGAPFSLRCLYLNCYESDVADHLSAVQGEFPEVRLGSYPRTHGEEHKVLLTLESRDGSSVERAVAVLLERLPDEFVMRDPVAQE